MTSTEGVPPPALAPCGRCGQNAYVGRDGIHCACTPRLSAEEHLARLRTRAEQIKARVEAVPRAA